MGRRRKISVKRQLEVTGAEWLRASRERAMLQVARARNMATQIRYRENRRPSTETRWASYDQLQELNRTMGFEPLTEEEANRLETEATEYSSDSALDRKVCAVTDTWAFPRDAVCLKIDELPFDAMSAVLSGGSWCTQHIIEYYDCSDIDRRFEGLLLSRRALDRDEDGYPCVWMLKTALNHLRVVATQLKHTRCLPRDCKPPRFAIADGFVAGVYPEIDNATVIERQAIGLAQLRGVVKVVYGGPGNILHSHLLCWDNRNATIACRVPSVVSRENFHIILAGPMTPPQEVLLAKRHECSGTRVLEALQLLRRINPLYAGIEANDAFDAVSCSGDEVCTRLESSDDTDLLVSEARARQSTVTRAQEDSGVDESQECTIVESQTVLMETVADQSEQDRLARAFANVTSSTHVYVARRSTTILKQSDPNYMELLFPHLLTFGIGGFQTARSHRYSQRDIVVHYLRVSTNRFAEDSMYKLAMFDYLSTAQVKSGVFLRVGRDPTLATAAMRVSPSQLKVAMHNRAEERKAWKEGRTFVPLAESPTATTLLKSINATTSKMWGSNEEREAMARKADAMTIRFGAPSVFWTLTPNPDCSITCAFWTGKTLPNGRPDKLSQCTERNMPCSSEMARIIMGNTVVQAEYYRVCCQILIDILFAWDTKANKPKARRGIFGFVEALLYSLEQQGRLFIHHHGVAWIAGLPKTQSDWDRLLASDVLKDRFERYCASIFSAELPVYDTLDKLLCPRSDCDGELTPISISKKYKHLLKSSVPAPAVAECSLCEAEVTESDIASYLIQTQSDLLDDDGKAASSPQAVEAIRQRFAHLSSDAATARVQLSRLLLKDQIHAWTHVRSCIKGRVGTKCRYNFFRDLVSETGFNKDDEIAYRRRLGNQWLNTYISVWRRIFHFNMDARLLWSGNSLQASRYALQYAVKQQSVLDNAAVVELSFKKRVQREAHLETSEYAQGVGRLLCLTHSSSGVMEMGAPLATAIIMIGQAVTIGCSFQRLVLLEGINFLNNHTVEAMVVSRHQELVIETTIAKYMDRPKCLEHYCWYSFCSWFDRDGPHTTGRAYSCTFTTNDTTELREHVRKHSFRYHEYPRVPEIIGPRLPDASRLGNEDYSEKSELYYRMAILLYHPFRDLASVLDANNSAKPYFDEWDPFADPVVARALEYHQQYYICLEKAQQYRERRRAARDEASDDDDECLDEDVLQNTSTPELLEGRTLNNYVSIPGELYSEEDYVDTENTGEYSLPIDQDPTAIQQLLFSAISPSTLPRDDSMSFSVSHSSITRAQVNQFQLQGQDAAATDQADVLGAMIGVPQTTAIAVEAFHHTMRELSFCESRPAHPQIEAFASIRDVSTHFSLNARQHVAFTLIAIPLLSQLLGVPIPQEQAHVFNNSPLIVTGAGGTGKSQIIAAVRALLSAWGSPNAIKVVASTGIAAASLQGCTMHNSVGLGINATRLPKHILSPSDSLLRQWAPTLCVVADEVSMVDLAFFGLWEEAVRHAKDNVQQPFGGIMPVLMFDHCQLRAVKCMPMFKTSNHRAPLTPAQERGSRLYQSITKVVYLNENMRFSDDPQWGQWLERGRVGNWTSELRSFIASIPTLGNHVTTNPGMIQTISTDNQTRASVNHSAIEVAIQNLGHARRVYVVPARLSRPVSTHELTMLRQLPDNKTGNIPIFLHIYVGMPVRIKANQCLFKGVANGATGQVHHIDWDPQTSFTMQPNGAWLASAQPTNIYIDISNSPTTLRFPLLPANWPSSVMPIYSVTSTVAGFSPPLSIKGFPIVPAFGTTVHGVQGETRSTVAITSLRPSHVRYVDPHALYVALSRLRTRHGLHWIGQRPSDDDFNYFRPDAEILLEETRLMRQSDRTLDHFAQLTNPLN